MAESPAFPHNTYCTTEARQKFPGLLQEVFGSKGITGVERYNQVMGAIIPLEAVLLLAGEAIDSEMELRIRNAAKNLLQE